jgi:hypothetical protein
MGAVAMPASNTESLISHLSGGLHPTDRAAFRQAAEAALANSSICWGPGLIHRTVASIWRQFFRPPSVPVTTWTKKRRPIGKLIAIDIARQARAR